MDFEKWLAVLTLLIPLFGQLVVLMMMRRDLNFVMEKVIKHEERLDKHDLILVQIVPHLYHSVLPEAKAKL